MGAIAHQFDRVSRIVTVGAAILFAIFHLAVTRRMGAFVDVSHFFLSIAVQSSAAVT